ncbi:hypothetical protein JCM9279_004539 [Rhodotorula babjevae]
MAQEGRRVFTTQDKDHLAQFLVGIPRDKRETPTTHKEMERRHPEHSYQAWMNHYKKVDKEGIERRIEGIRRQRERDKQAARSAKGKQRARDDDDDEKNDQLADDTAKFKKARTSTAGTTTAADADAPSTKNKKKKRKALELPRPSSSDDSDLPTSKKRSAGRKKYTAEDFKHVVRVLYRAEQESWLKQRIYQELEAYDPDHTIASWQTYHRDNRDDLDASLVEYRKLKKGAKKTKKDKKRQKREASTESAASSVLPPPHKKQKQRREEIELSDDDDDDAAPGPSASAPRLFAPVASSSKSAQPAASTSTSSIAPVASTSAAPARAPRASLPAMPSTSLPAKSPRTSLPAPTAPAPASTSGKGNRRAVDPDELPAPSTATGAAAREAPRAPSVEHAPEMALEADEAAPFGEQDTAELVHQLARAELKGWEKDTVWNFMAKKLGRSPEDWRAYYLVHVVDLLVKVAHKVGEILAAQERKRKAAAAAAQQEKEEAERLERERAEAAAAAAAAAAEAERIRLEEEREEAQRRAREAEEQREREEQARLDAEEEARQRATAEAAELERMKKELIERAEVDKVRAQKTRQARQEKERARRREGPSTSPPPFLSQEPRPVAVKPASTSKPAASAVLTPRSTPPVRAAAEPLFLPTSPITRASIEAMYAADLDGFDEGDALSAPDASGSSLPHLSQYSVAPSPFLNADELIGARENGDDEGGLASRADTDDRELDAQLSAAVAASVKVERDDNDDALALELHAGDDDDDDAPIWDPLLDVEYHLIIDSHELVEALSARAAAAATRQLDAGPSAAVERTSSSSKKRRRPESPARDAGDELEAQQQQPASKRQRLVDEQPASAPVTVQAEQAPQAVAAAVSAAPPLRSSPFASRRVPRASLAAVASGSPTAPPLPTPQHATSTDAPAPAPAPTPAAAQAPAPTPSGAARRPLKEDLADVAASSGLSYMAVRDLYFCVSALSDMSILRDVAAFLSPAAGGRRPEEGSAAWDRARRRVDKYVWSAREDEVVLEGTDEARARVDERKGAGSVERRREFLRRAKMNKIADMRASLYARKP